MNNAPCRRFRFLIPFFVLAVVAVLSLAVWGLWNGVLAGVLGVKTVTYWQAMGILVLAKILFAGFPGKRGPFGPPWKRHMMEHWQSLSPEQREKMREEMRRRFGDWPRPPWCDDGPKPDNPGEAAKA